jgi:hypothetical protein
MSDDWHRAVAAHPGGYRAYRRLRAQVLARDGFRCGLGPMRAERGANDVCVHRATQAHHLDGVKAGHDPQRMIASCKPCNIAEGDPTQQRGGSDPPATVDAWWLRASGTD